VDLTAGIVAIVAPRVLGKAGSPGAIQAAELINGRRSRRPT